MRSKLPLPSFFSLVPLSQRIGLFALFFFVVLALPLTLMAVRQPQTSQQQAATPSGGFCPANIDYEGDGNYGNYSQAALSNPNVGGVDLSYDWMDIEPQQGVFNWGPGDKEMAAWAAQGKKFTIVVRYIGEGTGSCSGQQYLPAWEIARIPHFCSTTGHIMPDYFDPTFTADLKAYVQAIADHIANSPYKNNLLYVRAGVGIGGESFPYAHPGTTTPDKTQLEQYGYTPTKWAAWQRDMMTSYKNSLSYAKVIYPLNGQDVDPATGQDVSVENGKWAAANGLGLGQQGLTAGTNSPLFQQMRAQYPQMYIQYQTVGAVGSGVSGNVQAAEKNGAQFVEWYTNDISNPANQSAFAQFQQFVDSKYSSSCNTTSSNTPQPAPSTTQLTLLPAPSNGVSPTPTIYGGVTPIFNCLGSCPTPTSSPTVSSNPTASQPMQPQPSGVSNNPQPSTIQMSSTPIPTNPSGGSQTPSTQPSGNPSTPTPPQKKQTHGKHNKGVGGLLKQILDLIKKLLDLLKSLLGNSRGGNRNNNG